MQRLDWARIRTHYAAHVSAARKAGQTQQMIARAGGLSGQNAISKLLRNHNQGPSVETFVKAVQGLGLDLSVFFQEMEQPGRTDVDRSLPSTPSVVIQRFDAHTVDAIIKVYFERLGRQLDRITRDLGVPVGRSRRGDHPPAAHRAPARRRPRKTA
jgi:transcriptional regulator with XRE-family HTH domain